MAKENKRGNREAKKPKAVKAPVAASPTGLTLGQLTPIKAAKKSH
jgi:hypothetical protein